MDYIEVEGHSGLYRDPKTNSIINRNGSEYNEYINRKAVRSEEQQKTQNIEEDLASLKDEMNEIKSLLKELVSNG
tara:strand:- start:1515 stop:1739 length:225 start_codon:yes stop_codon:yes gene_type:complete